MPAHSEDFPWSSYYGHYRKLESIINSHSLVESLVKIDEGLYEIDHARLGKLKLFVGDCYSFGVAEYYEVLENYDDVDIILISSAWCGYTDEIKCLCRDQKIGLFQIGNMMGALNDREYWLYLDEYEQERFE